MEKVMVAEKSSPAKKADWEGVTVTRRPSNDMLPAGEGEGGGGH